MASLRCSTEMRQEHRERAEEQIERLPSTTASQCPVRKRHDVPVGLVPAGT